MEKSLPQEVRKLLKSSVFELNKLIVFQRNNQTLLKQNACHYKNLGFDVDDQSQKILTDFFLCFNFFFQCPIDKLQSWLICFVNV